MDMRLIQYLNLIFLMVLKLSKFLQEDIRGDILNQKNLN